MVVTIVVLIILATISVNAIFSENGLIKMAEQSREKQKLADELERLELIKGEVLTDVKNKGHISVDKYVNDLISKGIVDASDVTEESDGSKTVITDTGYEVNIATDGEYNVIITINGKAADAALKPKITKVTTSVTEASKLGITIEEVNAERYEIQYKKSSETKYQTAYSGNNNSYTITGLDADEIYNIRIIVTNSYGSRMRDVIVNVDATNQESEARNVYSTIMNMLEDNPDRYDKTIKFRKIRMQSFTISIGIILSYILYVVLMMNKEKLTPDILGYLDNKNILVFGQWFVAILLGNVAACWYILSIYRPLLPESKYAGYNSSTYKSVYKDDIADYLEHSEVHIGKFWDAEKRRNKIEKIYKITKLVVLIQIVISTVLFLILK